jgi:hypothetical protein
MHNETIQIMGIILSMIDTAMLAPMLSRKKVLNTDVIAINRARKSRLIFSLRVQCKNLSENMSTLT